VTGGTGYLGGNLVARLAAEGEDVVVLVREPGRAGRLPRGVRTVPGDVTDPESLRRALQGCNRALHVAAHVKVWDRDPGKFEAVNVGGLGNLLRVGREAGLSRIVYTSSFIALGPTDGTTGDEDWELRDRRFHNEYEKSKTAADRLAREEARRGAPLVILYPGVIYGPGRLTGGNLLGLTIANFLAGRVPGLLGKGDRRFCYAYVGDVVRGHLSALRTAALGERYILGGENRTMMDLFAQLQRITGSSLPWRRIPYPLAAIAGRFQRWRADLFGVEPVITDEVVRIYRHEWAYSSRRAEQHLGYRITPFSQGLESAVQAVREDRSV